MDERSIDTCDRSAPDRASAIQKDPLFGSEVIDSVRVLGAPDTRRCDVPGSLRHMATSSDNSSLLEACYRLSRLVR